MWMSLNALEALKAKLYEALDTWAGGEQPCLRQRVGTAWALRPILIQVISDSMKAAGIGEHLS